MPSASHQSVCPQLHINQYALSFTSISMPSASHQSVCPQLHINQYALSFTSISMPSASHQSVCPQLHINQYALSFTSIGMPSLTCSKSPQNIYWIIKSEMFCLKWNLRRPDICALMYKLLKWSVWKDWLVHATYNWQLQNWRMIICLWKLCSALDTWLEALLHADWQADLDQ